MDSIRKNWFYIFITIIVTMMFLSYLYLQFFLKQPNPPATPIVISQITPSPPPQLPTETISSPTPEYQGIKQVIPEEAKTEMAQQLIINQMIANLPYTGNNFSLSYSLSDNTFTVRLKEGTASAQEFDSFLKDHGILERSWLKNINYQNWK